MKVVDLRCAQDHRFEGWFASDADEAAQRERGLLACPLCGDADVSRMPSAPRLNLSSPSSSAPAAGTTTLVLPAPNDPQAQWLRAMGFRVDLKNQFSRLISLANWITLLSAV